MDNRTGFILTRQWRQRSSGLRLDFWIATDTGPIRAVVDDQECLFFIERTGKEQEVGRRAKIGLRSLKGVPVDAVYFRRHSDLKQAREDLTARGVAVYESDLKPDERFLMERFIRGSVAINGDLRDCGNHFECRNPILQPAEYTPDFRIASLDIETGGTRGPVYCVGVTMGQEARTFMLGEGAPSPFVEYCATESDVLRRSMDWLAHADPDVIIGWNVVDFDLAFLQRRCEELGLAFQLGRASAPSRVIPSEIPWQSGIARIPGRIVLDGIQLMRLGGWPFEEFSLDYVARELLGRGKLIDKSHDRLEEIRKLFREDKVALAKYNLEDCRLVEEIFREADLLRFAVERARITGLQLDRHAGSVAAFDFQYLPRLHRAGYVAPDVGTNREPLMSPGGYVLDSLPGLYNNVLVLDFKSLYPSIIRTFKIDPLGMAAPDDDRIFGFEGASFSRHTSILPELIAGLSQERERARQRGDKPLSQAIKIIMNSFYGVLGSTNCRFYDPKLASSITRRGHELIRRSKEWIEGQEYTVIYGDTDSLFVWVGDAPDEGACRRIGSELSGGLNAWWKETLEEEYGLESFLEVEFETHYLRFLMPTIRGSEKGSKKRYAGLIRTSTAELAVQFRGLESVRTDWTPLARQFQRELYRRVFMDEPYEDYVQTVAAEVAAGNHDERLLYHKRLRRKLEDYKKNVPPHVQAARKLEKPTRYISYAITVNGPEPEEDLQSPLDYSHYLQRQLAPVADGILHFLGTSFARLTARQLELF